MTALSHLVLRPVAPWRRAAFVAGLPSHAPAPPTPPMEEGEDLSLARLLDTARQYASDWVGLFGDPADLLGQPPADANLRGLLRAWTRNLAWIVRHLVLLAALAIGPLAPTRPRPSSTAPASAPGAQRRSGSRTLAIALEVVPEAPAAIPGQPDRAPQGEADRALPHEAARCASLYLRIAATLDRFDLCARRFARRLSGLGATPSAETIRRPLQSAVTPRAAALCHCAGAPRPTSCA